MKPQQDLGISAFEENIKNFNYYVGEPDLIRDICLYSIGLKNQLEISNIPWVGYPGNVKLAEALAYIVSPLIQNKLEIPLFSFILNTKVLSDIIDTAPELENEFRPLVEISKTIKTLFDEDWCNEFLTNETVKFKNTPINDQPINTVQDLLNLLNQVVVKETLIDDFRIEKQFPVIYETDFSTGKMRIERKKKEYPEFTGFIDCVMSDTLTVDKFINVLSQIPPDTWVHSVRLKGSMNMVYVTVEKDGLVICD